MKRNLLLFIVLLISGVTSYSQENNEVEYYYLKIIEEKKNFLRSSISLINNLENNYNIVKSKHINLEAPFEKIPYNLLSLRRLYYTLGEINNSNKKKLLRVFVDSLVSKRKGMQDLLETSDETKFMETPVDFEFQGLSDTYIMRFFDCYDRRDLYYGMCKFINPIIWKKKKKKDNEIIATTPITQEEKKTDFAFENSQKRKTIKYQSRYVYSNDIIEKKRKYINSIVSWIDEVHFQFKKMEDYNIDIQYNQSPGLSSLKHVYRKLKEIGFPPGCDKVEDRYRYESQMDSIRSLISSGKVKKKRIEALQAEYEEILSKRKDLLSDKWRLKGFVDSLLNKKKELQEILNIKDGVQFMETPVVLKFWRYGDVDMLRLLPSPTMYENMCMFCDVERIKKYQIRESKTATSNSLVEMANEEYSHSLTAAKNYYDKDVDFDKYFPKADSVQEMQFVIPNKYNILGDTVCIFKNLETSPNVGFAIADNGQELMIDEHIPVGNYIVSGYVFCQENLDSIRAEYGINEIEKKFRCNQKDVGSSRRLKEDILLGKIGKTSDLASYLALIKMSSIDTINGYHYDCYCYQGTYGGFKDIYQYKFYNEIRKHYLNKEVMVNKGGVVITDKKVVYEERCSIFNDDLTNEKIKLCDSVYVVKDVVVKASETQADVFLVLEGSKTGSFGYSVKKITLRTKHPDSDPIIEENEKMDIITTEYIENIMNKKESEIRKDKILAQEREHQEKLKKQEFSLRLKEYINKRKQNNISKYGLEMGTLINNGRIALGMTKNMCREAWGVPMNSYRTKVPGKQSEVWLYNYKTRVYFENGKVVRIDD